ncbi:8-oxo-dGDP phosphatase NUDT18 isoform X2 [Nematostella vectensis]|uniref:8-oxo-dGDP phosphatase NUDT18 isoform X2 n=1 Tax=Nematostella vectensis TaxID=45351 RepID=UPI002076E834|nr:8-oxo-dGDP phosphatase NUDT18 isoform X2 [Nematostella vectensis]
MQTVVSELEDITLSKFPAGGSPKDGEDDLEIFALGRHICYIVAAVIIREDGKILMMREAKESCLGKWYLPAGRLEKNESLVQGAKREVIEETGLEFEPSTMICIDTVFGNWIRVTFTGKIIGGKLKTKPDKESLEAAWFTREDIFTKLKLRAYDICPAIDVTLQWHHSRRDDLLFRSMPVKNPQHKVSIIILAVFKKNDELDVLLRSSKNGIPKLPKEFISPYHRIKERVTVVLQSADQHIEYDISGVLKIEHVGSPHGAADGMCLSVLVNLKKCNLVSEKFHWINVSSDSLKSKISKLLDTQSCVSLIRT